MCDYVVCFFVKAIIVENVKCSFLNRDKNLFKWNFADEEYILFIFCRFNGLWLYKLYANQF